MSLITNNYFFPAEPGGQYKAQLDRIEALLRKSAKKETNMAKTIDDVLAVAKKATTAGAAAIAILKELRETIKNKTNLSAEDQAKVDAIFDTASENADALIAAANVGTDDETPEDVKAVEEFESLPPQEIDQPEG